MRPKFAALMLAFGVIGMADLALGSIYVPGEIRDGIYIRPHFVSAPKLEYQPAEPGVIAPKPRKPPPLPLLPREKPKLGAPS